MTRFYLITGFLGAGKTTFLRQMLQSFAGEKVAVIVNDFGKERVDATLLEGMGVELSEINNGSIFCACQIDTFHKAMEAVMEKQPDIILTEASGMTDPTNLSMVLQWMDESKLCLAGTICLCDATRFLKVLSTARVVRQQLESADAVVINKTDLATPEQLARIHEEIDRTCPGVPVCETTYAKVSAEWMKAIQHAPDPDAASRAPHIKDITLSSFTLRLVSGVTRERLGAFLEAVTGDTYRLKGFVSMADGVYLVDCVGPELSVTRWEGQTADLDCLTVLYGNGLPARKSVKAYLSKDPLGTIE